MTIEVCALVRNKARLAGSGWWVEGLAALVADLERDWGLRAGQAYPDATEAWVASVVLDSGESAVLKLVLPQDGGEARREITTLVLAAGAGCARILRHDADRGALLLERLGPSLAGLGWPARRRQDVLVGLAAQVWRPAPDCGLPTGAEKAGGLAVRIEELWTETGRPCSRQAVDQALSCARRREAAHDPARARLLHGDVHAWNALARGNGEYALVDPDGLLAEPEYDLGVIMREDPVELIAEGSRARAARLTARGAGHGLDAAAVWEWGVVERVSTGLLCVAIGLEPVGSQMLRVAERVVAGA